MMMRLEIICLQINNRRDRGRYPRMARDHCLYRPKGQSRACRWARSLNLYSYMKTLYDYYGAFKSLLVT